MNTIYIDKKLTELNTIQDILRWAVSQFNFAQIYYGHGTNNPWDESLQLVLSSLSLPLDFPIEMYCTKLTYGERIFLIKQIIRRIKERIPVPYLINKCWFCGLEFYVDTRVIIPRSPFAEIINDHFNKLIYKPPINILDMCTGNGCIAIACAYAYLETNIDAVDVSLNVLAVTEKNIKIHNVENRINLILSDLFDKLPSMSYDIIITNPPYVNKEDINLMPKEFYTEPKLGLLAGNDGLKFIKRILANAIEYLSEEGILLCEVGNSMIQLIKQYPQIPFKWIELNNGGIGIFMLTRKQLSIYNNLFKIYRT